VNQNPTLVKALVCDRVAELRRSVEASAPRPREQRRRRGIEAARTATGWLLIELGLRLTLSRGGLERPVVRRYA
jgi:hypothetical protein